MNNLDTKDNKIASTSTEDSSQTEVTSNHGMESKTDFSNMDLNSNWTFIFNFYEENGIPKFKNSKKFKENYGKLTYRNKLKISNNFYTLFFGPLYYIYKGMWRKALGLIFAVGVLDAIVSIFLNSPRGIGAADMVISMTLANQSYYLYKVKKSKSFNVFEKMF